MVKFGVFLYSFQGMLQNCAEATVWVYMHDKKTHVGW